MKRFPPRLTLLLSLLTITVLGEDPVPPPATPVNWPQFRGPNGQGLAPTARIPSHFGPDTNVLWKTPVPAGHSSPVIWKDRLFLTANEKARPSELVTFAFDTTNGRLAWQQAVECTPDRRISSLNHPASSTPAVDAERVYVYFGTYGLLAYDHAGTRVWERRLETPKSKYGMATSPILYGDTVILVQDGDGNASHLLALHRATGQTVWEQPRPLFKAGWSTPMIFSHDDTDELIVLGSRRLTAYDPATGQERWWLGGFPEETVGVPVAGDGLLFASAAALGGRGDDHLDAAATWKMTVEAFDRNHDNQIQRDEMTAGFAFIQRPELPRDNPRLRPARARHGRPAADLRPRQERPHQRSRMDADHGGLCRPEPTLPGGPAPGRHPQRAPLPSGLGNPSRHPRDAFAAPLPGQTLPDAGRRRAHLLRGRHRQGVLPRAHWCARPVYRLAGGRWRSTRRGLRPGHRHRPRHRG
ncbi:MAG: PQQ-binding-like beta-propeller repeat protein [Verrucomicrobia bacterium]|nr:PQQ-binding-like beta-propeller repeat protein [Verrucomicrobiota bacterium]